MTSNTATKVPLGVVIDMANQLYRDQNEIKRKENQQKIRQEKKDKNQEYRRKWYDENADQCREKCRDYYWTHREEINKRRQKQRLKTSGCRHVQK